MTHLIEFKHFTFQYKAQVEPTLKDINLTIEKGQKVLIIGASGSGKSTLGQCLNGIIPNIHAGHVEGDLLIEGQSAFNLSVYDKSYLVSTVLQDPDGQFIGLSVGEDLAFSLENDCLSKAEMDQKIAIWANQLELTDLLNHRPQDLSGGQKQRVSLAGVLIDESPILLFDEPLASLDPKAGQDTIELIDRIHQENDVTTIIIEHRLEDVLHRSVDKVVLIHDGQIVFDGSPNQLLQTTLLQEHGIREPLYITVLRDLGVDLSQQKNLSDLVNLDVSQLVFEGKNIGTDIPVKKPLLEVRDLSFAYDDGQQRLKNLSFAIKKGERLAIVGKNGAGKSTLAKALAKFVSADGNIIFKGEDISQDSIAQRASRIGYVLQNPNQMISQTMIFDEVALGLKLRGIADSEITERVQEVLKVCGLYEYRNWPISALSFGQKKRVTIASILVLNPEIVFLDEPTAGQDKKHYTEIMTFLDSLREQGHTIVMITHDMQLMLEYSDRCLVIADGQLLADLSPASLFSEERVMAEAHLKPTSLFTLAQKMGVDPIALTEYYGQGGTRL